MARVTDEWLEEEITDIKDFLDDMADCQSFQESIGPDYFNKKLAVHIELQQLRAKEPQSLPFGHCRYLCDAENHERMSAEYRDGCCCWKAKKSPNGI